MDKSKIAVQPVFFEENRVYRIYKGGKPFHRLFNRGKNEDTMFPEEWIASKVKAINPKYFGKRDGVSIVKGTEIFFDDFLKEYPDELLGHRKYDCLVKFLDSAIRLPFQVHPTPAFAKKHFGSEYGKTEAWLVVATRENAKIYFGFNRKITKEELSRLEEVSETEKDIMSTILYGIDAKVGDIYLIKAGLIHAIGAGCTIVEVQEPTDFTIQPERWCGDYHISFQEEYIGLDKDTALDCINYDLYSENALISATVKPKREIDTPTYIKENLITYADTPCFAENRHILKGGTLTMDFAPSVWILLEGKAKITGENYEKEISAGDYFYLPFAAENKFKIQSENATLIECLPSKQD